MVLEGGAWRSLAPTPFGTVRCVTAASDGALWIAGDGAGIARLDPSGAFDLVRRAEGADLLYAAAAANGDVYFAGYRPGGGVVYIVTSAAITRIEATVPPAWCRCDGQWTRDGGRRRELLDR